MHFSSRPDESPQDISEFKISGEKQQQLPTEEQKKEPPEKPKEGKYLPPLIKSKSIRNSSLQPKSFNLPPKDDRNVAGSSRPKSKHHPLNNKTSIVKHPGTMQISAPLNMRVNEEIRSIMLDSMIMSPRSSQVVFNSLSKDPKISNIKKKLMTEEKLHKVDFVSTGMTFRGQLDKNNLPNGVGRLELTNGDFYEGEFRDGKFEGVGLFSEKNGPMYEGSWKASMRNGEGVEKWPDGRQFKGKFNDDCKNGYGKVQI